MTLDHLRTVHHEFVRVMQSLTSNVTPEGKASTAAVKPSPDATHAVIADYEQSCDDLLSTVAAASESNTHLCREHRGSDDAIGTVLEKLRALGLEERTLIFCISDNGDSSQFANREDLRGHKWLLWEGGIREPWLVQWKGRIPAGRVISTPVIQLDVLPTALAAAGAEDKGEWQIDGRNILPLLEGKTDKLDRDALYWRFGPQFAVRRGDWKLVCSPSVN